MDSYTLATNLQVHLKRIIERCRFQVPNLIAQDGEDFVSMGKVGG